MGKADLAQRPSTRGDAESSAVREGAPALHAVAATLAGAPAVQRLEKAARDLQPPPPIGQVQQPVQRVVAINYTPDVRKPKDPLFKDVMDKGFERYGANINWVELAVVGQRLIKNVKKQYLKGKEAKSEEAAEVKEMLEGLESELDKEITTANQRVERFDRANLQKVTRANWLIKSRQEIESIVGEIQDVFFSGGGGFSAIGRATEMEDLKVHESHVGEEVGDNHYLSTITLGGVNLGGRDKVLGTRSGPQSGPISLKVDGVLYSQGNKRPKDYRDTLAPAMGSSQKKARGFTARARGVSQDTAMGRTNARGYAWVTETPGWDTTPWEWLHIRGAALGGATAPGNLVLGVRDSNTHMMPFEANLRQLADLADANRQYYSGLDVTWSISGKGDTNHIYDRITIEWNLKKAEGSPKSLVAPEGTAVFAPLKHDTVLSKGEVRHLQSQLKMVREAALPSLLEEEGGVNSGFKRGGFVDSDDEDLGERNPPPTKVTKLEAESEVRGIQED